KVDSDALPPSLQQKLRHGRVDLDDPAVTLKLLQDQAVLGVLGTFDEHGMLTAVGVNCALCHSVVDDSIMPGIGHRIDGLANRDLNIGAILASAPNLQPFIDLLKVTDPAVDGSKVQQIFNSWGPGKFDAELFLDGKEFRPDGGPAATL